MRTALQAPIAQVEVARMLGMGRTTPDAATRLLIEEACAALERTAQPRGIALHMTMHEVRPLLAGRDIAAHLAGCSACVGLACTLGAQVDALLRAQSAGNMALAVVMDAAASVMVEAAAAALQAQLEAAARKKGLFLTGRFSPGYGDYPIEVQGKLIAFLDAPRSIGLSATATHILTPRKSITALCGLADHPVRGKPAGCENCALRDTCAKRKEGKHCNE